MSLRKRQVRQQLLATVRARSNGYCEVCKRRTTVEPHHITARKTMPHGGYVPENVIALCAVCHKLAERYFTSGITLPGYNPTQLYEKINSSLELATAVSLRSNDDRTTSQAHHEAVPADAD